MGVKDIFSHKKKLSQRKFGNRYSKDARMGEVFGDQKIAKTLDKSSEKHEFYDMLKSKKEGGVTKREMKEVFGELMAGKGRTISKKEAYEVAKEFFGDERVKYIMPKKKGKAPASAGNASSFGGARKAVQNIQKDFGPFGGAGRSAQKDISGRQKKTASSAFTAKNIQSTSGGFATGVQNTSPRAIRSISDIGAQSKTRRKSISAGLAAIVDVMGPAKGDDKKNNKGDFFRAINATRKNTHR
jgi:hypothetical protein